MLDHGWIEHYIQRSHEPSSLGRSERGRHARAAKLAALAVAETVTRRTYLIEKGSIRYEGLSADLARDYQTRRRYLGV